MNKLRSILLARVIAIAFCVIALVAHPMLTPTVSKAQLEGCFCYYGGQPYSEGACRGGQRCIYVYGEGMWQDDPKCLPNSD